MEQSATQKTSIFKAQLSDLHSQVEVFRSTYHPHISLSIDPSLRLPERVESQMCSWVEEALNNVGKHAQAQHASIVLLQETNSIVLTIQDDGHGIDTDAVLNDQPFGHNGLRTFRETAVELGGEFQMTSQPGRGSQLIFRIPIAQKRGSTVSAKADPQE